MTDDILDRDTRPVVQIQIRDPTPLQGSAQDAKIASTILYLATQGLQVFPQPNNLNTSRLKLLLLTILQDPFSTNYCRAHLQPCLLRPQVRQSILHDKHRGRRTRYRLESLVAMLMSPCSQLRHYVCHMLFASVVLPSLPPPGPIP